MTVVESEAGSTTTHVGDLNLRRFRAGEFSGEEQEEIAQHTSDCASCRTRLLLLQEEHRQFERDIPFERFAGGVERACRVPRPGPRRVRALSSAFGLVAAAAVVLLVWPFDKNDSGHGRNSIKSGSSALIRIASPSGGDQRSLLSAETTTLRPGERIRLGYHTPAPSYLVALSVDDKGEVSLLYPEGGGSLSVAPTQHTTYLPDSLELTGSGRERVFLFLSDQPLKGEAMAKTVRTAHAQAKGDLASFSAPTVDAPTKVAQFSWLFHKP